jgi:hypothetical protein
MGTNLCSESHQFTQAYAQTGNEKSQAHLSTTCHPFVTNPASGACRGSRRRPISQLAIPCES